jgi:signal peptidase I
MGKGKPCPYKCLIFNLKESSFVVEATEPQTVLTPTVTKPFWRELLETLLLTAVIFMSVNFMTGRFKIFGMSMDNSFKSGQFIIVNRLAYQFGKPERGDVVVLVPPGSPPANFFERLIGLPGETDFIKRIVAIPGDKVTIERSSLIVNGQRIDEPYIREPMNTFGTQTWDLQTDQYFVMGDNRNYSKDSRYPEIGPIHLERVVGKVVVVYWPFEEAKLVEHYQYP